MRNFFKKLLLVLLVLFILVQFYPKGTKNSASATPNDISTKYAVPENVHNILSVACYDCHSNNTRYPWYASIQPVRLWLDNHINDGKKDLNFSEFATYSLRKQYRKLEEVSELVKEGEMPLKSYTLIHKDARLSEAQKNTLMSWAENIRDSMKANYPADSLLKKK